MKRIICFISVVLIALLSGCPNNPFSDGGASYVSLGNLQIHISRELSKSIDVSSSQVTQAVVTLTAPDHTVQTRTWQPGGENVFYYDADLTGLYDISVQETDTRSTVSSTNIQATFQAGFNYYITVNVGGHVVVSVETN